VAESRAKLIARDQVGKLFGAIQEARQVGLGIDRYTWRTSNDNRVRDTHEKREGESYSWNDPPGDLSDPGDGGHPGFPINCRCWAEPDLTAILENL
jgi:SPP1 gp7 family putative phage head morphogenesis protein